MCTQDRGIVVGAQHSAPSSEFKPLMFLPQPLCCRYWSLALSILKEINPEHSLEERMPKLKLQYFGHLMRRADSLEKTLMLGKIEGKGRKG